MYRYLVIFEQGPTSWGAYVPDLPGCVAVGDTRAEVERDIHTALAMHLQCMLDDHEPIPSATSSAEEIEISLPHPVA